MYAIRSYYGFDSRMYRQDILGSIAHAKMLGKQGIIPNEDSVLIQTTLNEVLLDIEAGKIEFEIDAEDIHMNIEKILISRIGDTGKRLHTGRSRNDQVALDIRLYLRDEISEIEALLVSLSEVLLNIAEENLVITSYSIHYTKLYDFLFFSPFPAITLPVF